MKTLKEIEKETIDILNKISKKREEIMNGVSTSHDDRLRKELRPLEDIFFKLEVSRRFALDNKHDNLLRRIVWNIIVPIFVSGITAFLLLNI